MPRSPSTRNMSCASSVGAAKRPKRAGGSMLFVNTFIQPSFFNQSQRKRNEEGREERE